MEAFSYQLWFAVRYVHVASVTVLTGGAFMLCALSTSRASGSLNSVLDAATLYEWVFWSGVGVTVATGISNLGLKGEGLLGPTTNWGTALSVKLGVVLLLLALSVVRTDFVIRLNAAGRTEPAGRVSSILSILYGVTVVVLLGPLWMGLGLAHGRY